MDGTSHRFLDGLLFSNVFIALCAMAQTGLTYLLLDACPNWIVILLLGCATLSLYNFSMILSRPPQPQNSPYRRVRWIFGHYSLVLSITGLAIIAMIPLVFSLHIRTIIVLSITGLLAVAYNSPVIRIGGRKFGLRGIPGAKLFIIAAVWALSCVCVPITELKADGISISWWDTLLLAAKRFMFIVAITIPFDIRDLFQDQQYQLKTIPVLWGERKALIFCQVLLISYIVLLFIFATPVYYHTWALAAVTLFTGWVIFRSQLKRNEYYYFLFLDGTLLLQFLSVWTIKNLFLE